jgi:exodeoxyribonuclease VII large subunit
MQRLWQWGRGEAQEPPVDVILLVRGGGSIEDLWAFNDEQLARAIVQSPVPVVSGVGHETDFSIADFCADLRAPTPTAAAELVAQPQAVWLGALELAQGRISDAVTRQLDVQSQRLDLAASRLGRPSALMARQQMRLGQQAHRLRYAMGSALLGWSHELQSLQAGFPRCVEASLERNRQRQQRAQMRLELLDPRLVLKRGYAWLSDTDGHAITSASQTAAGQALRATLADGEVDLTVSRGA